jgi:hypothetical protein
MRYAHAMEVAVVTRGQRPPDIENTFSVCDPSI